MPFDTDTLSLRFDLQDDISPGTYEYTDSGYDSPIRVDVFSGSDLFWSQVNSSVLGATNVSITVTEYSATVFSGSVTFVGQDLGNYSAEFEVLF